MSEHEFYMRKVEAEEKESRQLRERIAMTPADVPKEASVVFVGGTTQWKWRSAPSWCSSFPRVHIGRVNWITQLWIAQELGAESCDGSGFLREGFTGRRASGLHAWLHLKVNPQRELLLT